MYSLTGDISKTQPPFEIFTYTFYCKHLHLCRIKTIEQLKKKKVYSALKQLFEIGLWFEIFKYFLIIFLNYFLNFIYLLFIYFFIIFF